MITDKLIVNGESKFQSELNYSWQVPESKRYVLKWKSDKLGSPIEKELRDENYDVDEDL